MKNKIVIYFLLFTIFCYSQQNLNNSRIVTQDKNLRAIEVVGYFSGIEISLDILLEKYPDLIYYTNKLRLLYNKNFSRSKINALKFLNRKPNHLEFQQNLNKTIDELKLEIESKIQNYQESEILNYLKETELKLNGEIEEQFLENILAFQYEEFPYEEFSRGFVKTYNTAKHIKAKNSDWSLKIPISWKASEANGENIIQKFVDDCGQGFNMITIMNQDISNLNFNNNDSQKKFTNEFFTEENIINFLPEDAIFLSYKTIRIANSPGCILTYEITSEKLGVKIKSRNYQYIFQNGNYLFYVNCSISTDKIDENLNTKEEILLPLYKMILNSATVSQKSTSIINLYGEKNQKKILVEISNKKYEFILDTGATISVINRDLLLELISKKVDIHFISDGYAKLADGKSMKIEYWKVSFLKVDTKTFDNFVFSVIDKKNTPLLLGMDFLDKLNIWKIDLENNKIFLKN